MNPSTNYHKLSYEQVKSVRESWANFINQWRWQWFITLTFRDKVNQKTANRKWNQWLRAIERALCHDIGYFRASELQSRRKVVHFHSLMLNIEGLDKYSIDSYLRAEKYFKQYKGRESIEELAVRFFWMDEWNKIAGFGRIYAYDPTKGAHWYLCKYITKELSDYKLGGCVLKT